MVCGFDSYTRYWHIVQMEEHRVLISVVAGSSPAVLVTYLPLYFIEFVSVEKESIHGITLDSFCCVPIMVLEQIANLSVVNSACRFESYTQRFG